jgi:hypothetical protein
VVTALNFEGDWTQNLTATPITPASCQTVPHTAGPNEVAVINFQVTALFQTDDYLFLAAAAGENGGALAPVNTFYNIDGTSNGVGNVSASALVPLTSGTTYVFGAFIQSNSPVTVDFGLCHGTVSVLAQ